MIIDECPHCAIRHVQTRELYYNCGGDPPICWRVLQCQNVACQRLVLREEDNQGRLKRIFPFASYDLEASAPVPNEIREDFREAGMCLGAACYKASLVMSRRALQRCLKEQGCTQNKLVDAINYALENAILRPAFHPLAEEVREYGNLGAHPDDDQLTNATQDNAQQVLEFVRLLIHEFYEVPASAAQLKQKREGPATT